MEGNCPFETSYPFERIVLSYAPRGACEGSSLFATGSTLRPSAFRVVTPSNGSIGMTIVAADDRNVPYLGAPRRAELLIYTSSSQMAT
jgi:hypothetical protein